MSRRDRDQGEVLVAILNNWADFHILQNQGWYRIPLRNVPRRWPPRWLAFYQTKVFGDEAYTINYFGRVTDARVVPRRQLFPDEMENPKSDQLYCQIFIDQLQTRHEPLRSLRPRRLVFVPTTWAKFSLATEFNDIFDDSPLEDILWRELKQLRIPAERQWVVHLNPKKRFVLDFAIFCHNGNIDVETDGDSYHIGKEQGSADNLRNNELEAIGWHVLRFTTNHIQEQSVAYCVPQIIKTIDNLGGLAESEVVYSRLYPSDTGMMTQQALFESGAPYEVDGSSEEEM